MDSSSNSDSETCSSKLAAWTKHEKFALFEALKYYGSDDVENISQTLKKSKEEIRTALKHYKKRALKHVPPTVKAKKATLNHAVPLANWAELAAEFTSSHEQQTEEANMASALRLISEFEDIPKPNETDGFNFQELYNFIANGFDGRTFRESSNSKYLLEKCIIETALYSKSFIDENDVMCALDKAYETRLNQNLIPKDLEMATLQQLNKQKVYNPFNISEEYLRPKKGNSDLFF